MVRPRKRRCIRAMPVSTFYKPQGIALHELKGVTLTLEGFEAMRLVDGDNVNREEAAEMLGVSPSTLCRILAEARGTVARALTNGWALRIEGGDFVLAEPDKVQADRPKPHYRSGGRKRKARRKQRSAVIRDILDE